jgi:transposase-like protein
LMRKLFKRNGAPAKIVTDKLRSYPAALRELIFSGDHCTGKSANNRADVSPVDSETRTGDAAIFSRWRRCSCRGDSRSSSQSLQP